MILNTNLEALAAKIPTSNMIQHLEATGWKSFKVKRKDIAVYQYTTDSVFEQVTIPLDEQLSDFSYAMYTAVKSIAAIESKPVEQFILEALVPNSNVRRIHFIDQNIELGSVFWTQKGPYKQNN